MESYVGRFRDPAPSLLMMPSIFSGPTSWLSSHSSRFPEAEKQCFIESSHPWTQQPCSHICWQPSLPAQEYSQDNPQSGPRHSSKNPGKKNLGGKRAGKSQPWKVRSMRDKEPAKAAVCNWTVVLGWKV